MSRSYKKNPIFKDSSRLGKGYANRKVRRYKKKLSSGGAYKKLFPQYDIHDWVLRETLADALESRTRSLAYDEMRGWESSEDELNINKCIQKWKKFYVRK